MPARNRFEIVAPLPAPQRNLHLAVDRGSRPPRAVVLAFYPPAVADDPGRLGRLAGEMERAVLLFHPNVLAPASIEAVGDELAAVTAWRDAVTLRDVLDGAGRLPPDVAARIAADVCSGLGHAHSRPEPVVHGLLRPEAVLLDASGIAAVSGFGMPGGSGIADDLLGVADLLHECLAGEPPEGPSAPLQKPGIPEALAAVVNRARAAEPEGRYPTAERLGAAIAEAVPLAPYATVAAYLDSIVPAGSAPRGERRRKIEVALAAATSAVPEGSLVTEEISEHDIVGAATPPPGEAHLEAALRIAPGASEVAVPAPAIATPPPTPAPSAAPHTSAPTMTRHPTSSTAIPTPPPPAAPIAPAHRERGPDRLPRVPLGVAFAMGLAGVVVGFGLARLPWSGSGETSRPAPEAQASGPVAPADPAAPVAKAPRATSRRGAASAPGKPRESVRPILARADEAERGTGFLDVTAPDGAEVWLDGRRIGTGSTRREIPEGDHRIEVRYQGAKVAERFHVVPRETWTYAVTPTLQ